MVKKKQSTTSLGSSTKFFAMKYANLSKRIPDLALIHGVHEKAVRKKLGSHGVNIRPNCQLEAPVFILFYLLLLCPSSLQGGVVA